MHVIVETGARTLDYPVEEIESIINVALIKSLALRSCEVKARLAAIVWTRGEKVSEPR